jgi:hypothetical protein
VLTEAGVSAFPEKVKAVEIIADPKSVNDIRAFLALASFYRSLVPELAEVSNPLTELTRKGRQFLWGPSQQTASGE